MKKCIIIALLLVLITLCAFAIWMWAHTFFAAIIVTLLFMRKPSNGDTFHLSEEFDFGLVVWGTLGLFVFIFAAPGKMQIISPGITFSVISNLLALTAAYFLSVYVIFKTK